jgi:dTDP-4-dehydrorhamnose reductase
VIAEKPDVVISAAAYTAVDRAEDEPDIAYAVNVTGAGYVAEAAERIGAGIIHLSTDYVFAGTELRAYDEQSRPAPMSIYGLTKLEGERAVARINPMHAVVRTSWVYSPFSSNFLRTILKLATQQNTIRVVADQWGNPTSALDLADGLLVVARGLREHIPPDRQRRDQLVRLRTSPVALKPRTRRAICQHYRYHDQRVSDQGQPAGKLPFVL